MATIYGNTVSNAWRVYGTYSVTEYATYVDIVLTAGMQSTAWGINISSGLTATANVNGQTSTGSTSFYSGTGQTVTKDFTTKAITLAKTQSTQSISLSVSLSNVSGYKNGTSSTSTTVSVSALEHHTVAYNANGGSGAPSPQTKWYGTILTLSSTRPTRSGYTFAGWATSPSGSVQYQPEGQYGLDQDVTFYAVWTSDSYPVTYNANGGSGAPATQYKRKGVVLRLSSTTPTRTGYSFVGWGTASSSTTVSYKPGGTYTIDASITLYAIWDKSGSAPVLSISADRCTSSGSISDEGTYLKANINWTTKTGLTSLKVTVSGDTTSSTITYDMTSYISKNSGTHSLSRVISANLDPEIYYTVKAIAVDSGGTTTTSTSVGTSSYIMDFSPAGCIGIGMVADDSAGVNGETLNCSLYSKFRSGVNVEGAFAVQGRTDLNGMAVTSDALSVTGGLTVSSEASTFSSDSTFSGNVNFGQLVTIPAMTLYGTNLGQSLTSSDARINISNYYNNQTGTSSTAFYYSTYCIRCRYAGYAKVSAKIYAQGFSSSNNFAASIYCGTSSSITTKVNQTDVIITPGGSFCTVVIPLTLIETTSGMYIGIKCRSTGGGGTVETASLTITY